MNDIGVDESKGTSFMKSALGYSENFKTNKFSLNSSNEKLQRAAV